MRFTMCLCFGVLGSAGAVSQSACSLEGASDESCEVQANRNVSSALLQSHSQRIHLSGKLVEEESAGSDSLLAEEESAWKSDERVFSAMHYFKWWSMGKVKYTLDALAAKRNPLAPDHGSNIMTQVGQSRVSVSVESVAKIFGKHREEFCPNADKLTGSWEMYMKSHEESGMCHVLMQSAEGKLQYAAIHSDNVLASDPPVCSHRALSVVQQSDNVLADAVGEDSPGDAGNPELLDIATDPLVADCVKLFHRTAKHRCNKDFQIKVLSATMQIIDGFEVNMVTQLTTDNGLFQYHDISCDFELPSSPDANLLQLKSKNQSLDDPSSEALAEEQEGLEATLRMNIDVCESELKSSSGDEDVSLLAQYTFGHLPLYKGYGHLEDEEADKIPVFLPQRGAAPSTFSLKTKAPECFTQGGSEIVRMQGVCGSCWAFASASALMMNLCVHGKGRHSLASAADRFEVSVQAIMSCNEGKRGCSGGNALHADKALKKYGIGKERDFRYRCGGGRSEDHFDQKNTKCTSGNSWGASCNFSPNPNWIYGGLASAGYKGHGVSIGEQPIMQTLFECGAGYITFKTMSSFMSYKSGIYTGGGTKRGGHAVTLLGYGTEGSQKYWWILNSWGSRWGDGGYAKFLRGTNLYNIEDQFFCLKGTVKDGGETPSPTPPAPGPRPPPSPGRRGGSGGEACKDETTRCASFKAHCKGGRYLAWMQKNCQKTCGFCSAPAPAPQPAPTPPRRRTPAPPPRRRTPAPIPRRRRTPAPPAPPTPASDWTGKLDSIDRKLADARVEIAALKNSGPGPAPAPRSPPAPGPRPGSGGGSPTTRRRRYTRRRR